MGFKEYAVKRSVNALVTLIVTVILQFFIFRVLPGNPVSFMISPNFPLESRMALIKLWGLDKPMHQQFLTYVANIFTGRFGLSFSTQRPVWDEIMERLPNTLLLMGSATALYIALGIWLGVSAASKRGSRLDVASVGLGLFTQAMPTFFLGLLLLFFFGYYLPVATKGVLGFPIAGTVSRPPPNNPVEYVFDVLWHLTLPLTTLVVISFGGYLLVIRNLMTDALAEDYVLMARAKGLEEKDVLYRHGFRSILPPVVTMVGLSFSGVIGGAVVTETIFSWHGLGRYLYDAIMEYDYPVMQGAFFLIALVTILGTLIVDLIYGLLDPRIKY
ncbi:MAG: ABC transporter permease [Candidatus Bathyarchaeia archaeon]